MSASKSVNVAKLKAELSRYLRFAQRGQEITVTDHQHPVAKLVPIEQRSKRLTVRPALRSVKDLAKIRIPPATVKTDSLAALLEDRERDR
ncbi:MAG: type II toxin-antitoxin system Phd/YefM family antitoxin [Myxococcaceae bacterium]